MCGRLNISDHPAVQWLMDEVGLPLQDFTPRWNVSPSAQIHTLFQDSGEIGVSKMTWGLLPPWAKQEMKPLINARSETIWEKPSFKHLIKSKRAVIPVKGYYEWTRRNGKVDQAFYFHHRNAPALGLGAIYGISKEGEMQCCIVTSEATDPGMLRIHNRQPVWLDRSEIKDWISNDDPDYLNHVMDSQSRDLRSWGAIDHVSNYVNNARNEGPQCVGSPGYTI